MNAQGNHHHKVRHTERNGRGKQILDIIEEEGNFTKMPEKNGNTEAEGQHHQVDKAQYYERNVNVVPEQSDVGHANSFCCSL
ncbi:hypothetical protein [Marinobacter goseongensis]|uniref:hypothetical protein n=1 Tax=Marinobacter goseongensis TaxID=453838 RepID=UPI0020045C2A|nr:hypothetical protein [Marinobacter goseongensis]MCK7550009.1 hypothetical protein [Marinobacter goseongensis]